MVAPAAKVWMQTSVTGTWPSNQSLAHRTISMNRSSRTRGFTLIEILVVITIIAIVLSIAVLSLGVLGDDRDLRREALRMMALVGVAQDEAIMQGREFGLEFTQNGYRFVELDPLLGAWNEIIGDDTLRSRQLPEATELELFIEGQRVLLNTELAQFDDPDEEDNDRIESYAPHVLIFSSGDMTPFELRIVEPDRNQDVVLESDILGEIKFADEESGT